MSRPPSYIDAATTRLDRIPIRSTSASILSPFFKNLPSAAPNVSVTVEDGQALSFPDDRFDTVLCSLGLMFFSDPARGLAEFRRVLRPGGRAAVSVNTVPERSYNTRVHSIIARHVPSLAPVASRLFSLGAEGRLRTLYDGAGFDDVEVTTAAHRFDVPSFEDYLSPSSGAGSPRAKHSCRCPRRPGVSCAKMCRATSATRGGRSRSRWSSGLRAVENDDQSTRGPFRRACRAGKIPTWLAAGHGGRGLVSPRGTAPLRLLVPIRVRVRAA
jgi:hypothetical protein